jgi:hypothetical protein
MPKKFRELSDVLIMLGGFSAGVSCTLAIRMHRNVDDWSFWPPLLASAAFYLLHVVFRRKERPVQVRPAPTNPEQQFHAFDCTYHSSRVCNCADKPWP